MRRIQIGTALIVAVLGTLGIAERAQAQTPVVVVLGVGELVLEVPLTPAAANAQIYSAYVDARPKQTLTTTCVLKAGETAVSQCPVALTTLNLSGLHVIKISASIVAADGTAEGPQVAIPFDLQKASPPVGISPSGTSVRAITP